MKLIPPSTILIGVCYGLARFAYGLFLPQIRDDVGLSTTVAGFIGSGSYMGYCIAIMASAFAVERLGARVVAVGAALIAALGMAVVAMSVAPLMLAAAILFAGLSTGLASPPMAQAVATAIPEDQQARANTIINAGASIGVAVSGPVAFVATGQWRVAYAVFAIAALCSAVWLALAVPSTRTSRNSSPETRLHNGESLVRARALLLVLAATGMGAASSAFWTFSSDVIISLGHRAQELSNIAWIVIGIAGLVGASAGDLMRRFGVNVVHRGSLVAMAAALSLLVIMPASAPAIFAAAALFGAAYIMLTGVYLVWGVQVYSDRPAIGLGLPFLMIAVGQVIGSPVAGQLIGAVGYTACFYGFAGVAVVTAFAQYRAPKQRRYPKTGRRAKPASVGAPRGQ
jgi:predicted MFS family arabinose efflux permease